MNKCHININWVNDTTPAINDTNLNYMDGCIDTIDDRVISLDTTKANQSDLLTCVSSITYNTGTGIMTITLKDGTSSTIDTGLAKLSVNFDYDDDPTSPHYEQLIITLADGTYKYVDLSALITQFEFGTTDTIAFTVGLDGSVTADVRDGSITGTKLQPNYLADVTAQANAASAAASTSNANQLLSEGYANGTQGGVPVTSGLFYHNNAKYWKEQAQAIASSTLSGLTDVSITNPTNGQALTYDSTNQEWINSTPVQTLSGLTDTDINLPADGDVLTYDSVSGEWVNTTPVSSASDVSYDNTDSGLTATNVQDAVDEVNGAMQYLYNMTGGKNILPYPYQDTSKVENGVTYTDYGDGTVKATGGTPAGWTANFWVAQRTVKVLHFPAGTYILNGCPSGGSSNTYCIRVVIYNNGTQRASIDETGNGVTITILANDDVYMLLTVREGVTLPTGGVLFKPMLRDASISDDTYVPYAMTNRELTDALYVSGADSGTTYTLTGTSYDYLVTKTGYYAMKVSSGGNSTAHDMTIRLGTYDCAGTYSQAAYTTVSVVLPLKAGTTVSFIGIANDKAIVIHLTT